MVYQYPRQGGMEGQEPSRMAWDSVADVHGWGGEGHGRGKKQEMKLEKQVRAIADRGGTSKDPLQEWDAGKKTLEDTWALPRACLEMGTEMRGENSVQAGAATR